MNSYLARHIWPDTAHIIHNRLAIGGCDVSALADRYATPLYLLDEATLRTTMRSYQDAFSAAYYVNHGIHYASKALLNTALTQIIVEEGLGLDVVSGTELLVARRAGMPMDRIHFHGNAKTRAELERALDWGVGAIVVDSLDELAQLAQLSAERAKPQNILLRIAPDIAARTHAHIATGSADSKFGLPLTALEHAVARIQDAPGLRLQGLHAHIGSQIFALDQFCATIDVLLDQAVHLRNRFGVIIDEISPGGGLGVPYVADMPPADISAYAAILGQALRDGCAARNFPPPRLTVEPGRSIIARAGVALYRIVATRSPAKPSLPGHLHIDGGMADNIRPALYGARYTALIANRANAPADAVWIIAGRYCETGDILIRDVALPQAAPGDIVAIPVVGAYTLSMSSNYNLTPRPALILVRDGNAQIIQRRESEDEVLARDQQL